MHRLEQKSGRQSPESGSGLRVVSERMAESGSKKRTASSAPFAGAGSDAGYTMTSAILKQAEKIACMTHPSAQTVRNSGGSEG